MLGRASGAAAHLSTLRTTVVLVVLVPEGRCHKRVPDPRQRGMAAPSRQEGQSRAAGSARRRCRPRARPQRSQIPNVPRAMRRSAASMSVTSCSARSADPAEGSLLRRLSRIASRRVRTLRSKDVTYSHHSGRVASKGGTSLSEAARRVPPAGGTRPVAVQRKSCGCRLH